MQVLTVRSQKGKFTIGRRGALAVLVRIGLFPAVALGDREGSCALMESKIIPKQAMVSATNNFFIC